MKKVITKYALGLVSACLTLFFAGCAKDNLNNELAPGQRTVGISVSVADEEDVFGDSGTKAAGNDVLELISEDGMYSLSLICNEGVHRTKAELVNTTNADAKLEDYQTSFKVSAWNNGTGFFKQGNDNVETAEYSSSSSKWMMPHTYYWPQNTPLDFYAYSNLPETDASVSFGTASQTLSYTVPTDVTKHTDILLGCYSGKGEDTGTASIRFYHPLSAVKFVSEDGNDILSIKKITLSGLYSTGKVVHNSTNAEASAWTDRSGNLTLSEEYTARQSGPLSEGYYMLIPQEFSTDKPLTIKVTAVIAGKDVVFKTELKNRSWLAGKTYTYTVTVSKTIGVSVSETFASNVKSDVKVSNATGGSPEYVRVSIVGNWFDASGNIVAPWTYNPNSPASAGFEGLTTATSGDDGWIYNPSDRFYYHVTPVLPGKDTPTALFTKFSPSATVPGAHLEMNIIVQGVIFDLNKAKVTAAWGAEVAEKLK